MTEARRDQCTLLPRCSWKTSRRDTSLNGETSVSLRRQNTHPSVFIINSSNPVLLTEVDIQESSIGSLYQDFLTGPIKSFVHEVHPISHQRTQSLRVGLKDSDTNSFRKSLDVLFEIYSLLCAVIRSFCKGEAIDTIIILN